MDHKLQSKELEHFLDTLKNWTVVDDHHLFKVFHFPDYSTALAFVQSVGQKAEEYQHHPSLTLEWGKVEITLSTHDRDGITVKDIGLAKVIDSVFLKSSATEDDVELDL